MSLIEDFPNYINPLLPDILGEFSSQYGVVVKKGDHAGKRLFIKGVKSCEINKRLGEEDSYLLKINFTIKDEDKPWVLVFVLRRNDLYDINEYSVGFERLVDKLKIGLSEVFDIIPENESSRLLYEED